MRSSPMPVPREQEPFDGFLGARCGVVADPDGNFVGLMGPIDPARRSIPLAPGAE